MKMYFDMDGVLAKWNSEATLEEVATKGYFAKREPVEPVIKAVKKLIENGYPVHILSSVFQDEHSKEDKKEWLKVYLPELNEDNIHFSVYGHSKTESISDISEKDVLIDDFTPNLLEWTGKGVKVFNGINGTKGRWKGYSVHSSMEPELLYNQLVAISGI